MNITFEQACESYLEYVKVKDKPQSYRSIKSRLKNYLIPNFGNLNINDLKAIDYLEWQKQIEEKNLKYSYKKSLHSNIVSLLNFCKNFYDLDKNVASQVGNFKNKYEIPKNVDFWTYEEYKKFIDSVNESIYRTLFMFLYFTGCRLGEALALTFDDLNNNIVNINKTISKEFINGKRVTTLPKTKKSIRHISIDSKLLKELKQLKNDYITKYENYNDKFYIFGGDKPLAPTTIERKKNYYCKIANIKQIRIHDFRHSHASLLISKGIPVTAIAKRLGHSDISMTLNTYSHLMPDDEKRVLDTLNSLK